MSTVEQKSPQQIAKELDPEVVYHATIRLAAHATEGKHSNVIIPDLKIMDAVKVWEEDHNIKS